MRRQRTNAEARYWWAWAEYCVTGNSEPLVVMFGVEHAVLIYCLLAELALYGEPTGEDQ